MERLSLDIGRCMVGTSGERGLTPDILREWGPRVDAARTAVLKKAGRGMLGFMDLPKQEPAPLLVFAGDKRCSFDALLVIGIGGSALGTIALATALLPFYNNELGPVGAGGRGFGETDRGVARRLYVLDNVDPDQTAALLDHLDLKRTLVNVISKSGTTGESMAGYLVAKERMEAALGVEAAKDHFVFTTDPEGGTLRQIGTALGIPMFPLPPGVGGRFSVLSAVGLLPAAFTGMDVEGLLAGARDMSEWIATTAGWENPACTFAGVQYLEDSLFGRRVSVMMPYSARLRDVADWYRQLWAESLGKAVDREGRSVHVGPLPVKALGVTDQHSQLQLYSEGPDDKVFTFVGVREFAHTLAIPTPGPEASALDYLAGHTMNELLAAEQKATSWALAQRGRPSLTITLPRVDAFSVGSLMYLLELAAAIVGELYNIDAFDQPGVELSKKATYALMGRPGYEDLAKEIR